MAEEQDDRRRGRPLQAPDPEAGAAEHHQYNPGGGGRGGRALLLLAWAWRRGPDGRAVGWIAAAAFHLRALGADHLLVMRGKSWPLATDRREFLDLFQPVYADAGAAVFARRNR